MKGGGRPHGGLLYTTDIFRREWESTDMLHFLPKFGSSAQSESALDWQPDGEKGRRMFLYELFDESALISLPFLDDFSYESRRFFKKEGTSSIYWMESLQVPRLVRFDQKPSDKRIFLSF